MIPITINPPLALAHYISIKPLLLRHIDRILRQNGIWKRPRRNKSYLIGLTQELRDFLVSLKNPHSYDLQNLICQLPRDLDVFANDLYRTHPSFLNKTHDNYKILYSLFVDNIYESEEFSKYDLISPIELSTCPYCNRNYIYYIKTKSKIIKPEIDHFYPKKMYPVLAVSYYNLIPSCQSCNGFSAKGQHCPIKEKLRSPYLIKSGDFEFSYKIQNISIVNPIVGKTDVTIFFKKSLAEHCTIFNLNHLYSLHYDHAIELVIKQRLKYPTKHRKFLNSFSGLKFSKSEIDRMILGNYSLEKDQHKRPLSKLYQDIGKQLGLIK